MDDMVKKEVSATEMIREKLPVILKDKFKDGATFDLLWDELYKDKSLKKVMVNEDGEKRLGLLQGLSNRIKANKEDNIMMVKKEDGKNHFFYYDNTLDKLSKLTSIYVGSVHEIMGNSDVSVSNDDKNDIRLHEFFSAINQLENTFKEIIDSNVK